MKYNIKHAKEISLAFKRLIKEKNLEDYYLNDIEPKEWLFAAPYDKRRTLFHKRNCTDSRFSHSKKRVLYLACNSWRTLLETNQKAKRTRELSFFKFYNKEWDRTAIKAPAQSCLYLIKLKKSIKLFCINNDDRIEKLNQELNCFLKHPLKNIIHRLINVRSAQAYLLSQYAADSICEIGFDGILYKVKTHFYGNNGPILGSLNDSMIVIFEKKHRKHIIMNVPYDEENMECSTC